MYLPHISMKPLHLIPLSREISTATGGLVSISWRDCFSVWCLSLLSQKISIVLYLIFSFSAYFVSSDTPFFLVQTFPLLAGSHSSSATISYLAISLSRITTMANISTWTAILLISSRRFVTRSRSVMKLWIHTSSSSSGLGAVVRYLTVVCLKNDGTSGYVWGWPGAWCSLKSLRGRVHGRYM